MHFRNRVEVYISVNTGKTIKILILTPAAGSPFEHLCSQLVFTLFYILCQFKFRWCKRVFAVSNKLSIQPQSQSALCTLEGNKQTFSLHLLRNSKIFYITCSRIKMCRNLTRIDFLMSFPRILHICVLWYVIAFHLDMCRYINIFPAFAIVLFCFKSRDRTLIISRILEFPESVQRLAVRSLSVNGFLLRCIIHMIRMCIQTTVTEILRIFYHCIIKLFHRFLLLFQIIHIHYLNELLRIHSVLFQIYLV